MYMVHDIKYIYISDGSHLKAPTVANEIKPTLWNQAHTKYMQL